jgi:secreted trypsin-like serine protease
MQHATILSLTFYFPTFRIDPSRYQVVSGTLRYASGDVHNIAEVIVHNGYTGSGNNKDDIAVWRVRISYHYYNIYILFVSINVCLF